MRPAPFYLLLIMLIAPICKNLAQTPEQEQSNRASLKSNPTISPSSTYGQLPPPAKTTDDGYSTPNKRGNTVPKQSVQVDNQYNAPPKNPNIRKNQYDTPVKATTKSDRYDAAPQKPTRSVEANNQYGTLPLAPKSSSSGNQSKPPTTAPYGNLPKTATKSNSLLPTNQKSVAPANNAYGTLPLAPSNSTYEILPLAPANDQYGNLPQTATRNKGGSKSRVSQITPPRVENAGNSRQTPNNQYGPPPTKKIYDKPVRPSGKHSTDNLNTSNPNRVKDGHLSNAPGQQKNNPSKSQYNPPPTLKNVAKASDPHKLPAKQSTKTKNTNYNRYRKAEKAGIIK